ncbi:Sugar phosphate isomerase/epimerase [Nocardioides exalbidus]|uniref:Sugar phosphate isomerase/epimerase n=1 Tax=Nocardioides exalbidus TaxID=402596 RepID=A0A1H4S4J8_9ACTN|nr:sugar phosphate isomerase/epimerase [Nocardioides exalbidus]SEC38948.1 Sugar phosphate isomerase/epimerase [Nocardioides exalbidus]
MCFGHDGDAALERSLAEKGASRRGLLRGATVGAAALGALGASPATAGGKGHGPGHGHGHGHGHGGGRRKSLDHELISIQLYTLRSAAAAPAAGNAVAIGHAAVLAALARYGYERVELAGLYGETAASMRAILDGLGLRSTSSHDGISADTGGAHVKFQNAKTLGQQYVNVPYLASANLSDWQRWADQMNAEAAIAKRYGLKYGYHNHAHEFTTDLGGGLTPWEVLMDRLDRRLVHLEVDLYWAFTAGVNTGHTTAESALQFAKDVVNEAPLAVRQYHVKDRTSMGTSQPEADMCDLGVGVIDFPSLFRNHEVEEYIVENDTPDNAAAPLLTAAVGRLYLEHLEY